MLIGALLSMRNQSQQATLDGFFASVRDCAAPVREVSDRAFASARNHLHQPALTSLNDMVVQRADQAGLVERWCGLRVVAGDASVLKPAVRPCMLNRSAAAADQRLFALYLPGAELTLHASVYNACVAERQMLVEALDLLGPDDVLVLDRGYPAAWLVGLLQARNIRFVMRCDGNAWTAVRDFVRSGADDAVVTLSTPSSAEVRDWQCPATPPMARLVRQVAPNGQLRVLVTNLFGTAQVPCALFADLYHQRWRVEEAFKRIKLRIKLEAVSGLSQHALIIDVAAKILADNLTSLACAAAAEQANLASHSRKCNRSYAASYMQHAPPRLALCLGDVLTTIRNAVHALGAAYQRFVPGRSRPRPVRHIKPHPSCSYKS